jgi:endo-1,4-beta-xylanase
MKTYKSAILLLLISLIPLSCLSQPLAKDLDKFLGAATSSDLYRYFERFWNQITPGNDGKWGSVEGIQGNYNWTNLDKIYNYATKRNMPYKHHTLVWGQQQPGWIASLDAAAQRTAVENWIKQVGEKYPRMAMVDVVNEPLHAPPSYKNGLGGDGATGWDWVITSFELARKYCAADARLLINEYNILHDNAATNEYINLITLLKNRGLIDGIGIQGHYFEFRSHTDATNLYVYNLNTIKANLDKLAGLGLPIYITEFDIDEANDANQLAQYKIYFPLFWHHPAVKGITLWGYIATDVWTSHPTTYLLRADASERPALQWLRTFVLLPIVPTLISPIGFANGLRNPLLVWHAANTGTAYRVQVSTASNFATVEVDTTVSDTLLQLAPLQANKRYHWRVSATNSQGASEYSTAASFMTGETTPVISEQMSAPYEFELEQNYPNPFNPTTTIVFTIAAESWVRVWIFDLLGREIEILVNERMPAGRHTVQFSAGDLRSGAYFYKIEAGDFSQTKRMTIIK